MDSTIANFSQLNIYGGNFIQAGGNANQTHTQNEARPSTYESYCFFLVF
jgi:hypothetical protein